jgi:hypothetical protein
MTRRRCQSSPDARAPAISHQHHRSHHTSKSTKYQLNKASKTRACPYRNMQYLIVTVFDGRRGHEHWARLPPWPRVSVPIQPPTAIPSAPPNLPTSCAHHSKNEQRHLLLSEFCPAQRHE